MNQTQVEERTNLSIYHLLRMPAGYSPADEETLYPAIFALHGHGSNERDLIGLAPHLQDNLLWVSGRGPVDFAPGAYDWYPVTEFGKPDPTYLEAALKRIDNFISELLQAYPIDPQKLFLMGFSQGSMISMSFLLTRPQCIAGVIAQSGYVPMQSRLQVDEAGVKGKPVVMTHGYEDSSMPLGWSHQSRDFLLHYGVDVEYHNFHMGHTITTESLETARNWLEKRLA
ncbi:MAG: alpha/beta fold hydrolase [Anaerolineales bacterium]